MENEQQTMEKLVSLYKERVKLSNKWENLYHESNKITERYKLAFFNLVNQVKPHLDKESQERIETLLKELQ